jgi:hypothetical protein
MRPDDRPGQDGHRKRAGRGRGELRLCRGDERRRIQELRGAASGHHPGEQDLRARGEALRGALDVWEAERRHLLRHEDDGDQVQDQAGRCALHGACGRHGMCRQLRELLRCL